MESKSLDEVKREIATKFLGKASIHSVGISRAENAVRVYVETESEPALKDVLAEIQKEAAPYKVIPVQAERSSIT